MILKRMQNAWRYLAHRANAERELDAEVRAYFSLAEEEKMNRGMKPPDAMRSTRVEGEGPEQVKEAVRAARSGAWMETIWQEVRYGARMLRRSPGVTLIAVLTLALGIGANSAIFSVVKGVLLNQLPYAQPERLVTLAANDAQTLNPVNVAFGMVQDWKERTHAFSSIAMIRAWGPTMLGEGKAQVLSGLRVSYDYLSTLGVTPLFGREFTQDDDRPKHNTVIYLTYGFWQQQFGGRRDILGSTLNFNGTRYQIVAMLPESFRPVSLAATPRSPDVIAPLGYDSSLPFACRSCQHLRSVARLAGGVSLGQARAEMNT
ncbi:MAG: ABC transporter permease, partial [Gammaproteobacteria bacterium]